MTSEPTLWNPLFLCIYSLRSRSDLVSSTVVMFNFYEEPIT